MRRGGRRATSAIAAMFARGMDEVAVTATVADNLALKASAMPDLLCGESSGLPPAGFDHGNSPAEFDGLDLAGRRHHRHQQRHAGAGAGSRGSGRVHRRLLNRTAACAAALAEAGVLGAGITFVCSGTDHGQSFSLEDTAVCGALVETVVRGAAHGLDDLTSVTLTDSAMAAYRLWRSYPSPRLAFGEASHGRSLASIGLAHDLDFCAEVDRYAVAPRLHRTDNGQLVLRAGA
ncbi:MAG: 2-phosphosulfolactate phosphatase [Dehalococcoidia bacterium]